MAATSVRRGAVAAVLALTTGRVLAIGATIRWHDIGSAPSDVIWFSSFLIFLGSLCEPAHR